MKGPVFKTWRFICGYYVFSLLTAFAYVFISRRGALVLPVFTLAYNVNSALLLFFAALPAVQASALLIGFSWYFKDFFTDGESLRNALRSRILRAVFSSLIACMAISILAMEAALPLVKSSVQNMAAASADYDDLMNVSRALMTGRQYAQAEPYVSQALSVYPSSPEALQMKRQIEDAYPAVLPPAPAPVPEKTTAVSPAESLTFAELLAKARAAYESSSWIDAHYYATLALNNPDTHSAQEARIIAADAWNNIAAASAAGQSPEAKLFARKKQGYEYILQKEYLAAYYLFNDLNASYASDPDVSRYLDLARNLLLAEHFFIDEVYGISPFEKLRNIYFSVRRPDGGTDIVYAGALSRKDDGSGLVLYVRDLQIHRFNENREFVFSLSVDYAKVLSERAANFGSAFNAYFKTPDSPASTVPVIQLVSVDRKTAGITRGPVYSPEEAAGGASGLYVLNMPYADFLLLTEASAGAAAMSLPALVRFVPLAEKYGYSFEVFYQVLCSRLCQPLLVLILTMIAVIFAWRFRLKRGAVIKFRWLFSLPFCTAICYVIAGFFIYMFGPLMYTLIGFLKQYALFGSAICLVLIFGVTAVIFAAQTHE